jgi:hypothetical protein
MSWRPAGGERRRRDHGGPGDGGDRGGGIRRVVVDHDHVVVGAAFDAEAREQCRQ